MKDCTTRAYRYHCILIVFDNKNFNVKTGLFS